MSFTLVMVPPHQQDTVTWPAKLGEVVPGLTVLRPETPAELPAARLYASGLNTSPVGTFG